MLVVILKIWKVKKLSKFLHCSNNGPPEIFWRLQHSEWEHEGGNNQDDVAEADVNTSVSMQKTFQVLWGQQKKDNRRAKLRYIEASWDDNPKN